ncbi:MAG TPA: hypothetical protein DCQ50_11875 [Chryseobacterium sp.]|nr:hypothetical protein [Chryseobacterium sp.]
MKKSLIVNKAGIIKANPNEVWKIITTPEYFDRWMLVPGKARNPFGLGSKIEWIDENDVVYLTGEVIEFIPARKLVISLEDKSWKIKVAKGTVTYEFHLTKINEGTKVEFYLGDLSIDPEGQSWFDSYNSSDEISAINKLIESRILD